MRRLALLGVALALACSQPSPRPASHAPPSTPPQASEIPLHRRWSKELGQGGQPLGEAGFRQLAQLGYVLVLSVDGAAPDVEGARRHGLRTAHVPIGYDGISHAAALQLLRAARDARGPVYVHCHHGRHRGSAAAALIRIARGLDPAEAEAGLRISGCSERYSGLYGAVRTFRVPSPEEVAAVAPTPERVPPAGLQAAMVQVAQRIGHLEGAQANEWSVPTQHPDATPAHEALLLQESFREITRLEETQAFGESFLGLCAESEERARLLRDALAKRDLASADRQLSALRKRCTACHATFRD